MADEANAQDGVNRPEGTEGAEIETLESVQDLDPSKVSDEKPAHDSVPLKKYMGEKDARRQAEAEATAAKEELTRLKQEMAQGATVGTISSKAKAIAEKYGTSEEFVAEVLENAGAVDIEKVKAELRGELEPKLTALERERAQEVRDRKFDGLLKKTLDEMPEYDGIVSKDAIKALALNPANAKKTLPQILEETYGNAIKGKRTLEGGRGGRQPAAPDVSNPSEEDFDRINSDPELKKKWAQEAEHQLRNFL